MLVGGVPVSTITDGNNQTFALRPRGEFTEDDDTATSESESDAGSDLDPDDVWHAATCCTLLTRTLAHRILLGVRVVG
jgi:hypothetical protein